MSRCREMMPCRLSATLGRATHLRCCSTRQMMSTMSELAFNILQCCLHGLQASLMMSIAIFGALLNFQVYLAIALQIRPSGNSYTML